MKIPSSSALALATALVATSPTVAQEQPQIELTRLATSTQTSSVLSPVEATLRERIPNEALRTAIIEELRKLSSWDIDTIKSLTLGNWGDAWKVSIAITFRDRLGSEAVALTLPGKVWKELLVWTINF